MELKFEFSKDFEFKRVERTLEKFDWYDSQGYGPRLPRGITKDSSDEEIKKQISLEFDEKRYLEVRDWISSDFSKIKNKLETKLKKIFGKEIPDEYIVYLTDYGVGGSYNLPNIVIFNINSKKGFKTVVHEIVHLIIEEWITKYEIQHWEKERIVDSILNSEEFDFLDYNHWQRNYRNTEGYIDSLFKELFSKNKDNFFSKIGEIRPKSN